MGRGNQPDAAHSFTNIDDNVHADAIDCLAAARIVNGTGTGTDDPVESM